MQRPRRDLDFLAIDEQDLLISDLMFTLFLQRRILIAAAALQHGEGSTGLDARKVSCS